MAMARLILPTSAEIHGKQPKYACTFCEWVGYEGEESAYIRHCLSHSHEEIRSRSLAVQAPALHDPNFKGGDQDWSRWVREHREKDPRGLHWDRWGKTGDDK